MKKMDSAYRYLQSVAIGLVALAGQGAWGQTNNPSANTVGTTNNATELGTTTVVDTLNKARTEINTSVGATVSTINSEQIQAIAQGENAPMSQLILRFPGVAEDSSENGDLHVRGEHANLQYRINDVLLPEGIAGFGLELDPRFINSVQLITGSLPAQYGFRTAGIVDIQTKTGAAPGGEVDFYGGSYDTFRPSFEYGGSEGKFNYFVDGSYDHNELGVENPTASSTAIHDETEQFKTFLYGSYILDPTSRLTFMGSASYSDFQVPDLQNVPSGTAPVGNTWASAMQTDSVLPSGTFNSAKDNETQNEENYYNVLTYQKSAGDLNLQLSAFGRESEQHFTPDPIGDLYLNGEASEIHRSLYSAGLQSDNSYQLGESHTIRAGGSFLATGDQNNTSTTVFELNGAGNPTTLASINDNYPLYGLFAGVYLQDEWRIAAPLTLNYGARFDAFSSSFDSENQLSPRVNLVYKPTSTTILHAGYSRYFTPPPVEDVSQGTLSLFKGTSGASTVTEDSPVKAERANYYDVGITQTVLPGWNVGLDGYYKTAQQQLDDGLFGQTLILSAFNYAKGRIYGLEFTTSYQTNGFSVYANAAYSHAQGEDWDSAQFLFGNPAPNNYADLNYVKNHWISLDHDQTYSSTAGVSYRFKEARDASTLAYLDIVAGSGLRQSGGGLEDGPGSNPIPNGASVPDYYSLNIGVEQAFRVADKQFLKARIDVVNVTDNTYELRSASGVGVNAAQYGERRGLFGTLSYSF
jgi:outer membrane receptor protein involved in Fe transport